MSRLWFNLRILFWHLQIGDPHWWSVHIGRNRSITMSHGKLRNIDGEVAPWIKLFKFPSPWAG